MSRIIRVVVLATALISALTTMSSPAGAVTWHNSGSTAFTATSGAFSVSVTGTVGISCTGATMTGVTAASNFVGATWKAEHFTEVPSGCVSGGVATQIHCTVDVTATGQPSTGVTTGVEDFVCNEYQFNTLICVRTGQQHVTYINPTSPMTGRFMVFAPGAMRTGPSCAAGLGGPNEPATVTSHTFAITAGTGPTTLGPIITRTA
jgi:hypothetical protein